MNVSRTLVAACLCSVSTAAFATSFEVPIAGTQSLSLAVASAGLPSGDPDHVAGRVHDLIEHDLDMSGYFTIVPTSAHLDTRGGAAPGQFSFDDWKPLRVGALVKFNVLPTGDRTCDPSGKSMCIDLYVYDALGGGTLAKKRLRAPASNAVGLAHQAANEALEAIVGQPGFFGASVLAVSERSGNKEIYLVDLDGDGARPITRNGSINLSPAWSVDRRYVAWTSYKRGNPDLFVKDLRSGDVRAVSTRQGVNLSPAWSPDGRFIVLARSAGADTDLFLIEAKTGRDMRQLTSGGGIDVSPTYSPDGRRVAFASERSGGSQIYLVSVEGGTPTRVTQIGGMFSDPTWSPDGSKIAFVSKQGGDFDVFTVSPDGSGLTRITQGMGDNEDPTWSPDSNYLVFTSTRDGRKRIWISTANGRHQVPVTKEGGWSQPVWVD